MIINGFKFYVCVGQTREFVTYEANNGSVTLKSKNMKSLIKKVKNFK